MNPLAPLLLLGLVFLQGGVVVEPRVVPGGLELQLGAQPILQRSGAPKASSLLQVGKSVSWWDFCSVPAQSPALQGDSR